MKFKIGDNVKGITCGTFGYESKEGKIVEIDEWDSTYTYAIRSDGYKWYLRTDTVELIEEKPIPVYIKNELNHEALETTDTLTQLREVIFKAYQLYDNDSQRLAYIKGYFAK